MLRQRLRGQRSWAGNMTLRFALSLFTYFLLLFAYLSLCQPSITSPFVIHIMRLLVQCALSYFAGSLFYFLYSILDAGKSSVRAFTYGSTRPQFQPWRSKVGKFRFWFLLSACNLPEPFVIHILESEATCGVCNSFLPSPSCSSTFYTQIWTPKNLLRVVLRNFKFPAIWTVEI